LRGASQRSARIHLSRRPPGKATPGPWPKRSDRIRCPTRQEGTMRSMTALRVWRRGAVIAFPLFFLLLVGSVGAFNQPPPILPGGKIGTMRLARGVVAEADAKLFDFCDPVILQPGSYRRHCPDVPLEQRLFIGYGAFFTDLADLNTYWRSTRWTMWFDGCRVALHAFGTSDRTLFAFPPAGRKDVPVGEGRVWLLSPPMGGHVIRYRSVTGTQQTAATCFSVSLHRGQSREKIQPPSPRVGRRPARSRNSGARLRMTAA